ncbi:fucolectin-4-like [Saccostrea cucullata]|uniref:fucolectin-4-like n=1 Tax=Saccostrea cuccullata TaxID=36930 RepID=UPI002ED0AC13
MFSPRIVIFITYIVPGILQQFNKTPYFNSHLTSGCKTTYVTSLLHCVSLCNEENIVSFFYNPSKKLCRWGCVVLYLDNTVSEYNEWTRYERSSKGNSALEKTVTSSSIFDSYHPPSQAVDGIIPVTVEHRCFVSQREPSPFWQVDLGIVHSISFVRIYNRMDNTGERFRDASVLASVDGVTFKTCGSFKGPGLTRQVIDIACAKGTSGQFVKVQILNNNLQLCEVQVYTL